MQPTLAPAVDSSAMNSDLATEAGAAVQAAVESAGHAAAAAVVAAAAAASASTQPDPAAAAGMSSIHRAAATCKSMRQESAQWVGEDLIDLQALAPQPGRWAGEADRPVPTSAAAVGAAVAEALQQVVQELKVRHRAQALAQLPVRVAAHRRALRQGAAAAMLSCRPAPAVAAPADMPPPFVCAGGGAGGAQHGGPDSACGAGLRRSAVGGDGGARAGGLQHGGQGPQCSAVYSAVYCLGD